MIGADALAPLLPDQVSLIWRKFGYKRLMPKPFVELVRMVLDEMRDAEIARGAQWSDEYVRRFPPAVEAPADYQVDEPPPYDDEAEADEMAAEAAGVYDPPVMVDLARLRASAIDAAAWLAQAERDLGPGAA